MEADKQFADQYMLVGCRRSGTLVRLATSISPWTRTRQQVSSTPTTRWCTWVLNRFLRDQLYVLIVCTLRPTLVYFISLVLILILYLKTLNRRAWIKCKWQLKRCMDKLSKSTYPSLAPITIFVISGLQSVIYWKNFCHVWWVSYGLHVINCICTLMHAVFWHTCTFSGYINRLCRHTVESYCVSWIHCPIIC